MNELIAIDFETADDAPHSACAIGIVGVTEGKLINPKSFLIRPPSLNFKKSFIAIHGITPEQVEKERTFAQIWSDIQHSFHGAKLVAYNAPFDRRVLTACLDYYHNTLTLHNLLARDPNFYMSVICDVFKPRNSEGHAPTEENRRKAQAAYRLLNSFKKIPGSVENIIDLATLRSWAHEVLRLAKEKDRVEITEQQIGSLLAHAPADPEDGVWPHRTVRELIEELRSDEVETGISIERFNMRGVYSKAMFEGGRQERELATQAYGWAEKSKNWPRTHDMLAKIGKEWDAHAVAEDRRAKLDRMKN